MDVEVDRGHGWVVLTLNRPHRLNAITDGLVGELTRAVAAVGMPSSPGDPRVVVIRGTGRAFSSGHDLKEVDEDETAEETRARLERLQDLTRVLARCPVPVVAAVQGWAIGAGAEVALAADLVVAETTAQFVLPEVGVGLAVTNGISRILASALGPQRAKRVLFFGETLPAEELHRHGLVSHVVAPGELREETEGIVAAILDRPPVALRWAKHLVDTGLGAELEEALASEVEASLRLAPTEFHGMPSSKGEGAE